MKITETTQICPYTGLRSFTEDESLYFKGRDEQVDQVTAQLEERKFLMLTGASGEGKSSLIYAGLVPNARAGFFKARFANWTVVDFRPERSPIKNMARALADKFAIHAETIETEMHRGFSSLTDLYLSSDFYIDEKEESWQLLSDADRKTKRRKATNLLVLVDQFEELFTNPENYYNETPSQEAQVLVNLILETSRLALQQNLPIYIVCTMRSDYIGQCSSFRGLPEYIGYSQFFVPRLKRKELKQVIEEPAQLSGNRITQRLTDRLVYDLAEGVDQLPILQHALNQIWLMADRGAEEMDLIHYAMVGGMPAHELPLEDQGRFQTWLDKQPDYQQKFFLETGLHKVIENHASRLYESAAEYYSNTSPGRPITTKEAKNIIALTFSCLTKIDNSRAVRNRMTLQEITAIINRPELSADVVGKVVNIFREEGNSFIRPFKTEEADTQVLDVDVVLDITHESLIRNWGMLHKWANQEFEFYSTFLDLKKQLDRWKENGKSSGYLLPIGPLSYFESWNSKCNPNAAWINRYAERDEDTDRGRKRAESLLEDLHEFLRKSARHVMISRAFIKYGAQKIALVSSLVILLLLCGFYWYDAERKKNENVVIELQTQSRALLASREVSNDDKATYLLTQERYSDGSLMPYLHSIEDPKEKISLSIDTYRLLLLINKKFRDSLKLELINGIGQYFGMLAAAQSDAEFKLVQRNKFVLLLAYDNYYNPESGLESILKKESSALYDLLLSTYQDKNLYRVSVSINLNQSVQHWLAFGNASATQIDRVLDLISPLRNEAAAANFDVFYPKGSYEPSGIRAIDFNAGYHMLASLYAAAGQLDNLKWCFDKLRLQPDYFTDRLFNNYENVLGYLYQYGHRDRVPELVKLVGSFNNANTPEVIYHDLMIRSGYLSHMFRVNLQISRDNLEAGNFHLNLCLSSREQYHAIVEDYERQLGMLKDGGQKDYLLAMSLKRRGMFEHKYHYDRGIPISTAYLDSVFDDAWSHYSKVNQQTLDRRIPMAYSTFGEIRTREATQRELFVYPDYIGEWTSLKYHSDVFYDYLRRKSLLQRAYTTLEDLNQIHFWIANMFEQLPFAPGESMYDGYKTSDATLIHVLDFVSNHPAGKNFDKNLLVLVLANHAFQKGDSLAGFNYFGQFRQQDIARSSGRYENWEKTFFYNQMMVLAKNMALYGRKDEAMALIHKFETKQARLFSYNFVADKLYDNQYDPSAFIFLDSALALWRTDDASSLPFFLEYRHKILRVLNKIGGEKLKKIDYSIFKDIQEARKFLAIEGMVMGAAQRHDYFGAMTLIPSTLTEGQDLVCREGILFEAAKEKESITNNTLWRAMDRYYEWDEYVVFFGFL